MTLLIAILLFLAPMASGTAVELGEHLVALQAQDSGAGNGPALPQDAFNFDATQFCGPSFNVNQFCSQAIGACNRHRGPLNFTCFRARNAHLRRRAPGAEVPVYRQALAFFNRMKNDAANQALCCGSDLPCKQRFSATALMLLTGSAKDTEIAITTIRPLQVLVSELMLLGCSNVQCLERLLLHELGHACQYSRHPTGIDLRPWLIGECFAAEIQTRADLEQTLGPLTAACIQSRLQTAATLRARRGQPSDCMGGWLQEAFADAVFSGRQRRLAHWAWQCDSDEDHFHAAPREYMDCLFQRFEPWHFFCPAARP